MAFKTTVATGAQQQVEADAEGSAAEELGVGRRMTVQDGSSVAEQVEQHELQEMSAEQAEEYERVCPPSHRRPTTPPNSTTSTTYNPTPPQALQQRSCQMHHLKHLMSSKTLSKLQIWTGRRGG